MNLSDILFLSYKDLREKKVRTALTIVMVVIGVASIVALVSLTEGISASISSELSSLGPTTILVSSAGTSSSGFTAATVAEMESLPNVTTALPVLTGSATLRSGTENTSVTIIGMDPQDLSSFFGKNASLYEGTLYPDTVSPESVVGYDIAFPSSSGGSQEITNGQPVTLSISSGRSSTSISVPVVGILAPTASSFIISVDSGVLMSLQAAETLLHRTSFNTILVKASNESTVSATANSITSVFGSSVRVTSIEEIAQTASSVIGSITTLLVLIAGISLLVAAIGIMNIMLISVYEHIHEIGIMKSVGFKNHNILTIFVVQALIIGFFGGVAGIIVGAGGAYGLASLTSGASSSGTSGAPTTATTGGGSFRGGAGAGGGGAVFVGGGGGGAAPTSSSGTGSLSFTPVFTLSTILTALIVAILVSVIAGAYPAWRASKLEPIEALRQL